MGKEQSKISQSPANVINEIEIDENKGSNQVVVCIYIITVCIVAQSAYTCFKIYHNKNKKKIYAKRSVNSTVINNFNVFLYSVAC